MASKGRGETAKSRLQRELKKIQDDRGHWKELPFRPIEEEIGRHYKGEALEEKEKWIEDLRRFNGSFRQFEHDYEELEQEKNSGNLTKEKLEQAFGQEVEEIAREGIKAAVALANILVQKDETSGKEAKMWDLIYSTLMRFVGSKIRRLGVKFGELAVWDHNFADVKEEYSSHQAIEFVFHQYDEELTM